MPDISSNVAITQNVTISSVTENDHLRVQDENLGELIRLLRLAVAHLEVISDEDIDEGWR